jgi:cytochrome c oxidase subunit I
MTLGLLTAAVPILLNQASVLYTFYPPLQANWAFYVGLVFVVVGSWFQGYSFYITYYRWRKENPDVRTPLMTFGSLITMVMWQIATLGIAVEILTQLLPWSLGLLPGIDPAAQPHLLLVHRPPAGLFLAAAGLRLLVRHAAQAGRRQAVQRLAGPLLLLALPGAVHAAGLPPSVHRSRRPVGLEDHPCHPDLRRSLPSLLTAFTVVASLEYAGRQRGGKGCWVGSPSCPGAIPR